MNKKTIAILCGLSMIATPVFAMGKEVKPGLTANNPFYFLDIATEWFEVAITSQDKKAQKELEIANEKIAEIEKLQNEKNIEQESLDKTFNRYNKHVANVRDEARNNKEKQLQLVDALSEHAVKLGDVASELEDQEATSVYEVVNAANSKSKEVLSALLVHSDDDEVIPRIRKKIQDTEDEKEQEIQKAKNNKRKVGQLNRAQIFLNQSKFAIEEGEFEIALGLWEQAHSIILFAQKPGVIEEPHDDISQDVYEEVLRAESKLAGTLKNIDDDSEFFNEAIELLTQADSAIDRDEFVIAYVLAKQASEHAEKIQTEKPIEVHEAKAIVKRQLAETQKKLEESETRVKSGKIKNQADAAETLEQAQKIFTQAVESFEEEQFVLCYSLTRTTKKMIQSLDGDDVEEKVVEAEHKSNKAEEKEEVREKMSSKDNQGQKKEIQKKVAQEKKNIQEKEEEIKSNIQDKKDPKKEEKNKTETDKDDDEQDDDEEDDEIDEEENEDENDEDEEDLPDDSDIEEDAEEKETDETEEDPAPEPEEVTNTPICSSTCEGKVTFMRLVYNGATEATIKVETKKGEILFNGIVRPNSKFTLIGNDKKGTVGPEIKLFINEIEDTRIHTSCSVPIYPGLVSGSFTIHHVESRNGVICNPKNPPPETIIPD